MADASAQIQNKSAFQKQSAVFLNSKIKKSRYRYQRYIGLGFRTPAEAISGKYIDKKCPFTGDVNIRGKIVKGMVISKKMDKTIVIRRHYLHFVKKYQRYEKRHRNIPVHCSPCFRVDEGDIVTAGECRPLSKTVHFNVLRVKKNRIEGQARKQFRLF